MARPETAVASRVARVLWRRKGLGVAIVIGSTMHASGHAFLAAAAGWLARGLAGGTPPEHLRSTLWLSRFGGGDAVLGLAVLGVLAAIAKLVGGALSALAESRVAGEVGANLRLEVLDAILAVQRLRCPRQPDHGSRETGHDVAHDEASSSPAGNRIAALTTHVHEVEHGAAGGVLAEARAVVQLAPLVVLLAVLAPKLAASAAIALVAFAALAFGLRRALKRAHSRAVASAGALVAAADEAVRHAELWATYGAEQKIRRHVAELGRAIARRTARLRASASVLSGTSEVLGALALVLTLALFGEQLGGDRGRVVPFAIAFFMAYKPLRDWVEARLARARGDEALRAALVVARDAPPTEPVVAREASRAAPSQATRRDWRLADLVVRDLTSLHGAHAPLSFRLAAGTIAAVVGPTGIGKTSLLRVLLGLDPSVSGSLGYDGEDLTAHGIGPQARPFAWVPQDAPILCDSLDTNVKLGRRDDDVAGLDARQTLAELGAGALAASAGESTLVAERAVSGGEKQWIAVARALATDLPVLLLDEPTSALDPDAERLLLAALVRLRGKRSVVIVTHRPAPIAIADVVVRLAPMSDASGHASGHDAEDGAGRDRHRVFAEEVAVDDVRARSGGKA